MWVSSDYDLSQEQVEPSEVGDPSELDSSPSSEGSSFDVLEVSPSPLESGSPSPEPLDSPTPELSPSPVVAVPDGTSAPEGWFDSVTGVLDAMLAAQIVMLLAVIVATFTLMRR